MSLIRNILTEPNWKPYNGSKEPGEIVFSGGHPRLPSVGEKVKVTMNGLGEGYVGSYFIRDGWLGLEINLLDPPEWYVSQNKGNVPAPVFGAEVALLS